MNVMTTSPYQVPLEVVFIPYWLEDHLTKNGESIETVWDYDRLSRIVSDDDISALLHLNLHSEEWLTRPVKESFQRPSWVRSYLDKNPQLTDLLNSHSIRKATNKINAPQTTDLFGPLSEPFHHSYVRFTVTELGDGRVMIGVRQDDNDNRRDIALMDDLLYVANRHMSMESLAKLPLFKVFLDKASTAVR